MTVTKTSRKMRKAPATAGNADLFESDLDAVADRLDSAIGPRANFAA
jgi:hypothetical protein